MVNGCRVFLFFSLSFHVCLGPPPLNSSVPQTRAACCLSGFASIFLISLNFIAWINVYAYFVSYDTEMELENKYL